MPESWDEGEERTGGAKLKPAASMVSNAHDDGDVKMWESDEWDAVRPVHKPPAGGGSLGGKASAAAAAAEVERRRQDELAAAAASLAELSESTQRSIGNADESLLNFDLIEQLLGSIIRTERSAGETALVAPSMTAVEASEDRTGLGAVLIFLPGQAEIKKLIQRCERSRYLEDHDVGRLMFLPLYGALSSNDQRRIFARPPPGVRKVVVATNIAETSVTIDDVRYVIDTGRAKEMSYDPARGLSSLADAWVSRAAAKQRRGRAGRTAPGACFALFSRHTQANLAPHQPPEMLRTPLQQLCLSIKALAPSARIAATLSAAPTPPEAFSVDAALKELCALRALDPTSELLTPLGKHLAHMPV